MDYHTFEALCLDIFRQNPSVPQPDGKQTELLYQLTQEMLRVNAYMNLTAITEYADVILKHYVDSLTVSPMIPQRVSVADIGCGAGFPSLPLAICRPDLQISAIDSTGKRIAYIEETVKKLGITNLHPITMRAEDGGKSNEFREKFHTVTARAVASLPVLCELCLPYASVGGQWIAMKAAKGFDEVKMAKEGIIKCGGMLKDINSITIQNGDVKESRCLITVQKIVATPKNLPRNFSQISKKPL